MLDSSAARSSRARRTRTAMMYRCGVIPVARLKPRANRNGSRPTAAASSSHLSFESRLRSMYSNVRRSRGSGSVAPALSPLHARGLIETRGAERRPFRLFGLAVVPGVLRGMPSRIRAKRPVRRLVVHHAHRFTSSAIKLRAALLGLHGTPCIGGSWDCTTRAFPHAVDALPEKRPFRCSVAGPARAAARTRRRPGSRSLRSRRRRTVRRVTAVTDRESREISPYDQAVRIAASRCSRASEREPQPDEATQGVL